MSNILLFEKDQEKILHLVFLLKLADIHCTVARTVEEVLSWVNACQMMVITFDLIILNSLEGSGLDHILLTELCKVATVPVICVKRKEAPPSIFLMHHVVSCHPEGLLDCVKKQLVSVNNPLPEERE